MNEEGKTGRDVSVQKKNTELVIVSIKGTAQKVKIQKISIRIIRKQIRGGCGCLIKIIYYNEVNLK